MVVVLPVPLTVAVVPVALGVPETLSLVAPVELPDP